MFSLFNRNNPIVTFFWPQKQKETVIQVSENYKRFVEPVYMQMLNPGICFRSTDEQLAFASAFKKVKGSINDVVIKDLLYEDNWRSCTTGAWLAFATNNKKFRDEIGHLLLNKHGYIGHFYALAKFGDEQSGRYLVEYLKNELQFSKLSWERFQDTAYVALLYIDRHSGSHHIKEINGMWDAFVNNEYAGFTLSKSERWTILEPAYDAFVRMYNFIESI